MLTVVDVSSRTLLTVTGAGCSHSRNQMSTNVLIEHEGFSLGIECPHPIKHQLHRVGASAERVNAWFVSHIHADHVSGLESLAFYKWYSMQSTTVICGSREVLGPLARIHEVSALGTQKTLEGHPAGLRASDIYAGVNIEEGEKVSVGPFSLSVRAVKHVVPTFAVKVETPDGSSFAYSADTVADSETVKWLIDSSLFAHDACGGPIHASPEDLESLVRPEDRSRCMLLHRDDRDYLYAEEMGFLVPEAGYSILL